MAKTLNLKATSKPATVINKTAKVLPDLTNPPRDMVSIMANNPEAVAISMAAIAAKDLDLQHAVEQMWLADEVKSTVAVRILLRLRDDFSIAQLNEFPYTGKAPKDYRGNHAYEVFKAPGRGKDGVDKDVDKKWYEIFARALPYVGPVFDLAEKLAAAVKDATKMPVEWAGYSTSSLQAKAEKQRKRKINAVGNLRTAMDIHFILEAINAMEQVEAGFLMEQVEIDAEITEVLESASKCLFIQKRTKPGQLQVNRALTVNEFTSLDVKRAKALGGSYENLLSTIARAPKKTGANRPIPKDENSFWDQYYGIVTWLRDHKGASLLTAKVANGTMTDDECVAFGDGFINMEPIMGFIHDRYWSLKGSAKATASTTQTQAVGAVKTA